MVKLVDTEQPLTEDEFCKFAKLFRGRIPEAFRLHYMHYNGGSTSEEESYDDFYFWPIKYGGGTIESWVLDPEWFQYWMENWDGECICWYDYPEGEALKKENFCFWEPFTFIPFGNDSTGAGTIFLISLRESDYGCVYVYIQNDGGGLCQLGDSFEQFLSRTWPDDGQ
jgi:hypothetical protein